MEQDNIYNATIYYKLITGLWTFQPDRRTDYGSREQWKIDNATTSKQLDFSAG